MPDMTCPVCGSVNASTRTFCWKCAADLHAPVADPTAPPPPPKVEVPLQPLLIGGGVALAAIALIAVLVVALTAAPAATTSPSLAPTGGLPTSGAPSEGAAGSGTSPNAPPATTVPATPAPAATAGPPATPKITPVPAPAILFFTGPRTVDCNDASYDGFITLKWEVTDAESTSLSIDGPGVYLTYPGVANSPKVPFSCGAGEHSYTLTTIGGNGAPAAKTLTITEAS